MSFTAKLEREKRSRRHLRKQKKKIAAVLGGKKEPKGLLASTLWASLKGRGSLIGAGYAGRRGEAQIKGGSRL